MIMLVCSERGKGLGTEEEWGIHFYNLSTYSVDFSIWFLPQNTSEGSRPIKCQSQDSRSSLIPFFNFAYTMLTSWECSCDLVPLSHDNWVERRVEKIISLLFSINVKLLCHRCAHYFCSPLYSGHNFCQCSWRQEGRRAKLINTIFDVLAVVVTLLQNFSCLCASTIFFQSVNILNAVFFKNCMNVICVCSHCVRESIRSYILLYLLEVGTWLLRTPWKASMIPTMLYTLACFCALRTQRQSACLFPLFRQLDMSKWWPCHHRNDKISNLKSDTWAPTGIPVIVWPGDGGG